MSINSRRRPTLMPVADLNPNRPDRRWTLDEFRRLGEILTGKWLERGLEMSRGIPALDDDPQVAGFSVCCDQWTTRSIVLMTAKDHDTVPGGVDLTG
jgi:hypothetical protein